MPERTNGEGSPPGENRGPRPSLTAPGDHRDPAQPSPPRRQPRPSRVSTGCVAAAGVWLALLSAGCGPTSPPQTPRASGPEVTLGGTTPTQPGTPGQEAGSPDRMTGTPELGPDGATSPSAVPETPGVTTSPTDVRQSGPNGPGDTPSTGVGRATSATVPPNPSAKPSAPEPTPNGEKPAGAVRTFRAEGPNGALRVTYDDFDLLKLLQMEPVTVDCVEKMPEWLRALDGKSVRLRGYMKPGFLSEGITRFLLVRDTGLCCYGPAGKIYDLVQVTLAEGQTTNYIELTPFDVVGTFRVRLDLFDEEAEDGTVNQLIIGLYHIENGRILRK